jgi:hypothetical protein
MSWLFSAGQMRSPVSMSALGECNAIRSLGLGHSELTFVSILESDSGASPSHGVSFPVDAQNVHGAETGRSPANR